MHQTETTNLDELLSRLRKEGVEAAKIEAEQIIKDAKQQATDILSAAKEEAASEGKQSQIEISAFENSSSIKLKQAARDVKLRLGEDLQQRLKTLIEVQVKEAIDPPFLQKMIQQVLSAENITGKVTNIQLAPEDHQKLRDTLLSSLGGALSKDCKIQEQKGLEAGFTLQLEGEDYYFEFSNQQIAKELAKLVSPQLQSLFLED